MAGERCARTLKEARQQYEKARTKAERSKVLDAFCKLTRYHRKYAIGLLGRPQDEAPPRPRRRGPTYSAQAVRVVEAIWKAADYPWSERLKALLPLWVPWARTHIAGLTVELERQVLAISARQIDRRLAPKKRRLKRGLYGRTKPGTLLKHHIPLKTDAWDVTEPGFTEVDLVHHSGPSSSGEYLHSLNLTDIHTGWCETRAVMGRGERDVVKALDAIRRSLPFSLRGIDSDNGSEFINYHLYHYCQTRRIQFTRGRPYKKDDNAHIEQKNWTRVRRILGWDRYDTPQQLQAINALYQHELRLMMNLFQPSVKLLKKERVGSRLRRRYDAPKTPLDRLVDSYTGRPLPLAVQRLVALRERLDPFVLSRTIDAALQSLERLRRGQGLPEAQRVLAK